MLQLGWVTLDNASNNNSMMEHLACLLRRKNIIFNHEEQHIQCAIYHISNSLTMYLIDVSEVVFLTLSIYVAKQYLAPSPINLQQKMLMIMSTVGMHPEILMKL